MYNDTQFQAYVLRQDEQGVRGSVENVSLDQLPEGDVIVRVFYSGVNYKDGLASIPDGKIVRRYPFIPGIDLAGTSCIPLMRITRRAIPSSVPVMS